jgi:iron complex outermembrane receptor protein
VPRAFQSFRLAAAGLALAAPFGSSALLAQAAAPAAGSRAVERASDAFGVRVGIETIGLYSEGQVRGLSLQDAGNYRFGGAYFVRAANLIDPVLAGVTIRVGVNALDVDFPAPTGVVEYRPRSPLDWQGSSAEIALREYGSAFFEGLTSIKLGEQAGLLVGAQASFFNSSAGNDNDSYRFGTVGEWRSDRAQLLAFGALNVFDLNGTYGNTLTDEVLPGPQKHPNRYVPTWGDHDGTDINGGLLGSVEATDNLTLRASTLYSRLDLDKADFVNLTMDRTGRGSATISSNPPRDVDAFAVSAGASWRHAPGRRLYGEVRLRASRNRFAPGVTVRIPEFDQDIGLTDSDPPLFPDAARTRDTARQIVGGVGYEASFGDLRLKGGVQRAFYERDFTRPGTATTSTREEPWLYDMSAVAAFADDWTGFASITRGLEDTGVAPANAVNRDEVLPAIVAEQREVGVRWRPTDAMTVIASAFSIEKPAAVFDSAGVYGLSGDLRHRGVELSLAGRPVPSLRLIAGGALLDAERSGERVDLGLISKRVPGVSSYQALAGATWSTGLDGLSLDANAVHWGARRARSTGDLETPPWTVVDVGALYGFAIGDAAASLRLRIVNLFDSKQWVASRSELLDRVSRRGIRLSLTLRQQN